MQALTQKHGNTHTLFSPRAHCLFSVYFAGVDVHLPCALVSSTDVGDVKSESWALVLDGACGLAVRCGQMICHGGCMV